MGQKKAFKQVSYNRFDKIDGSHPFKKVLPNGFVDYPARIRKGGKVHYFNFDLASEMGLIPKDHPRELRKELEEKILETFSIQIINEYDQMKGREFSDDEVKSGAYMATRYLQLQHDDKKGRTSGDGRSVWNGQISYRGKTWDISSGGTGATRLSPATSKFNKFFETGDPSISYGCGYAELDEGLATAILSKIFKTNNIKTEETLAIIDFGNNISINVRAYQCLLRPSHFFMYLKQDDRESLRALTDYYIETQREKKEWENCPKNKKKYNFFLEVMTERFARLAANLEDKYIFCWLDWDGDNILMDGGIIDYGSVRQFGLFHQEYRYDDVERFSTNILEQKTKAKYTIQTFTQLVDFIHTGEKKNISEFAQVKTLTDFDTIFEDQKNKNLLYQIGLSGKKAKHILKRNKSLILNLRKSYTYFERAKSNKGIVKIPDGVTCDAIFSMRSLLREYPQLLLVNDELLSEKDFIEVIRSGLATEEDLGLNNYRKSRIKDFQSCYRELVHKTSELFQESREDVLMGIIDRSSIINQGARVTGDSVTCIVDKILKRKKIFTVEELDHLVTGLNAAQSMDPENKINFPDKEPNKALLQMLEIIEEYREGL